MIRTLALTATFMSAGVVLAADKPAVSAQQDMEMRIALSPQAAKKTDRSDQLDLYRKVIDGDEKARKVWRDLPSATRTKIMADSALMKEASPQKTRAIKELGLMSPS